MTRVLILGGTRNLGHFTAMRLLRAGHSVTVLNRGITPDDLPADVERLHAAREDSAAMQKVLSGRSWDVVIDTTSYTGSDVRAACSVLRGRCERVVFISTGQVYLVRKNIHPPFRESDYAGELIPAPPAGTSDHDNWLYGVNKRDAEAEFAKVADEIPATSLRLPMIASERDHYARIQGYIARVQDGGPILVPDGTGLPIRHVYVHDVTAVIQHLVTNSWLGYRAFNVSYGESVSLNDFLRLLGAELNKEVISIRVKRELLESRGLIPGCSPFSGKWMSELDNSLSIDAFSGAGLHYTAPKTYVSNVVADYLERWAPSGASIPGYERRSEELEIAKKAIGESPLRFLDY
jgi:nucleoside-diphosphate-sugar epimerase